MDAIKRTGRTGPVSFAQVEGHKNQTGGGCRRFERYYSGAPGAARTASTRNHDRRELRISAAVGIVRRRRRSGGAQ
jgi:hypothetical protein